MLNSLENSSVTYEDLAQIEQEFEDVEKEIIRQEITLSSPIYARRNALISKIPNFWPLVFEQAPPEIDQHIQMTDGALLLGALTSLSVTRFEPEVDPRSVLIRFEFSENKYFENKVLEKKFWWRTARNRSWCGLVSEAVGIKWKSPEVDLTEGLLDLVLAAESSVATKPPSDESARKDKSTPILTDAQKKLQQCIQDKGINGLSFFAWFGFVGNRISAKESAEAEASRRNKSAVQSTGADEDINEGFDDDDDDDLEIFPDGGELAMAISEDLWPDAIKYFTQAQEQDTISDEDFESTDGEEKAIDYEFEDEEEKSRVAKKRKPN
ncbi:putative nucleosome assembly protein [Erysiphe necator]|uniref:Putative nap family protein n=1 Tax=Uncinula necator TaxID=52586 RepID=A0A0B1P2G7_UNCNE|nr:putative nucleosome assembly protein [Erysiphe necator]KHJ32488.1 putative nap family protein [Erysiphe necator]